ncbi:MAG TPA: exo-alpha-sialidase [Pricia sp.]|nr:exo-alpha-sialidase [Pricia sp.]
MKKLPLNTLLSVLCVLFCSGSFGQGNNQAPQLAEAVHGMVDTLPKVETWAEKLGWPAGKKVIILHADDVGMCPEANTAAKKQLNDGAIQSAAVMVPCSSAEEFIGWAIKNPNMDVGLHLTLTSEWKTYRWGPVSSDSEVPGLLDGDNKLWHTVPQVVQHASAEEVEKEIRAQIEQSIAWGHRPDHIDTHMGTLFADPSYVKAYLKVAQDYGIPANIIDLSKPEVLAEFRSKGYPLNDEVVEMTKGYTLPQLDYFTSAPKADTHDEKITAFKDLIKDLEPGLTEIIFHPAVLTENLKSITGSWQQRAWEAQMFSDPDLKQFFGDEGILFTNWQEIMERFGKMKSSEPKNKALPKVVPINHPAVMTQEFIYDIENAPTPECHASTIAISQGTVIASWFGGTEEKNKDVGIWVSRNTDGTWSTPVEVANGVQKNGTRYPSWNPVLFKPKGQPLYLFYKVGPSPQEWWGLYLTSKDDGKTWSEPEKLPDGILGPIKNPPVQLENGNILSPSSNETKSGEWTIHIERSSDGARTWSSSGPLNDPDEFGAIQPVILDYGKDKLQLLSRTKNNVISQNWSKDGGKSWSNMTATSLPNPNSGIDGVTLKDGRQLLVYNPTDKNWGDRVPLSIALSADGKNWERVLDLEPLRETTDREGEEYSYPTVIQADDGKIHLVYTWNRKTVKYVVLDPEKLQ